jgi:flagellin-like protein
LQKILKSNRGISPILATLLLIVIAVAAIVVTYAWVITFTTTTTTQAGARIKFDTARIVASTKNVTIYVRNWGDGSVVVDKVYIDGQDFTSYTDVGSGKTIAKDGVLLIKTTNLSHPFSFVLGSTYVVKVSCPATYWQESVTAS